MGNHITNSSFNLIEKQASSMNCSPRFYKNDVLHSGFQSGNVFKDIHAYFTSDMVGGLIQFAHASENNSNIQSAIILEIISPTELLLDVVQEVPLVNYIIWYEGIQFSQQGTLSIKDLIISGVPFQSFFKPIVLTSDTPAQYIPSPGIKNLYIQLVGGGGAGGGYKEAKNSCGGGGGAGGYIQYYGEADTFTYQCGTGGVTVAGAPGGDGTATTITGSSIIGNLTGNGGKGGACSETLATVLASGGNGGSASGGTYSFSGQKGSNGLITTNYGIGGYGASTALGIGGTQTLTTTAEPIAPTGNNGSGYGSGGSGAVAFPDQATGVGAGGNGGEGIIIVYEI